MTWQCPNCRSVLYEENGWMVCPNCKSKFHNLIKYQDNTYSYAQERANVA